MTSYAEVTAADRDVAAFLATQLHVLNIWRLPRAAWVARQDGAIVAVLVLTNVDYPAIHLLLPPGSARPFMRIVKLWRLAKAWLASHNVPVVAAPVYVQLRHFQSLLRRLGFVKAGEESDENGTVLEVIYAYTFKEPPHEDQVRTAE